MTMDPKDEIGLMSWVEAKVYGLDLRSKPKINGLNN